VRVLTDEGVAGEGEEQLAGEDEGGHLVRARVRGRRRSGQGKLGPLRAGPGVVRTRVAG
jgi:hypothetical protein